MAELTTQYLLRFPGFSKRKSVCHLFVADDGVVLGEVEDNKGTSVTNALELVCAGVADRFFEGRTDFAVYEWLPRDVFTSEGRMLEIKWHASGLRLPEWICVLRLPRFAEEAETHIRQCEPYTSRVVSKVAVARIDLDGAHESLQRIRRDLPPLPPSPDHQPRPMPPELTKREREVLLSLTRPLTRPEVFARPLTNGEIAAELFLSQDAVKAHLRRLYDKFDLGNEPMSGKRARLATEAVTRGVISRAELLTKSTES
jgi:DNA-binding CsgD family transcriptional regulator